MLTNYYKINPGGNITALVDRDFNKSRRIQIAKKILGSDPSIEQVGFIATPKTEATAGRIEMMGGEFCGNATRCLAYIIGLRKELAGDFLVESSGIKYPIQARIQKNYSEITLPLAQFEVQKDLVCLPGIVHIITPEEFDKAKALEILRERKLLRRKAVGVISYKFDQKQLSIKPFVWVRDTETLYEETSCASGSLALAYFLSQQGQGEKFSIKQPSGYKLSVDINQKLISISGAIVSIEKATII